MNKVDLAIIDRELELQINLLRFNAGERRKVLAIITTMQKELKAKLYNDLTDYSKARVKKLLKDSTEVIDRYYTEMQGTLDLQDLASHAAESTAGTFASIGIDASLPTAAVMKVLADGVLLQGSPLSGWWQKQSADLSFRYANAIRQSVVQGETLQQAIVRVFGSKKLGTEGIGFPDSVLRRNASALVHDSIMTIANNARMSVYQANEDIMKGYRWLSTLDGNICLKCVARSGATWDLEFKPTGGTKLPYSTVPLHVNCRCLILPILKTFKELGVDIEEPKGTRASDSGQIDSGTSFSDFLKRHDKAYQDDLLGPGRAQMWRDGKLTLSQLVDGHGRELTLKELRGL